tara:strand:+ start:51 stop:368 length:318 start_codon:yes stop_codon:yes gene_type:complete
MANLIIKPNSATGDKLILQDRAGGAVLTTADSGATIGPVNGDIIPSTDSASDLGSPSKQWQNVYTGDLHLKNERGSWTVIEEENYLTLRNNNTDKVYKLVMEEIE